MSELLKNVERTMYTFNFNNIVEICFNKTIKLDSMQPGVKKLSDSEKILFDNCIDKYMLAFGVVRDTTNTHLEALFNRR
jgi:hypothetical protein